jgi:hypothetical protein
VSHGLYGWTAIRTRDRRAVCGESAPHLTAIMAILGA